MTFKSKILAALTLLVFSTIALSAQTAGEDVRPRHKERGERGERANKMAEKLGLNEQEVADFKAINKKYKEELKAAQANVTSKEEMVEIRYANHKAKTAEVKAFLTPAQYAIFDKFEPRKGKKGKKGKRGKRGNKEIKEKRRL